MRKKTLLALLLFISARGGLKAQTFDLSTDRPSVLVLNGPWKFRIGDSPRVDSSRALLWTQSSYDDSGWQDYTINPKHSAQTAAQTIQSNELPGWQQHGHPGYTGYAWYRIRLQTPPAAHALALLMPQFEDDAYEVYVNGRKIGGLGKLDGWRVTYPPQPKVFSIPAAALDSGQTVFLAIRFWDLSYDALPSQQNLGGGLRGVPLLGPPELLGVFQQSVQEQTWKTLWPGWLLTALFGAVGMISLFLFLFSRSQREYLWAGISLTGIALLVAFEAIAPATNIPVQLSDVVLPIADCIGYFALPLAAMHLLGVCRPLWRRVNYVVMAGIFVHNLTLLCLHIGLLPPTVAMDRADRISYLATLFAMALLLLAIAVDGLRTIGRKAWLPLTPGLLCACGLIAVGIDPLPDAVVGIYYYFFLSVPPAVLIIFLMRFTQQQRENVRLVDDMREAQEVQQVLIPEQLPEVPGLIIESEYRPAREVGGDFFQIVPHVTDGSLLIVAGDVTGKGLRAGMLVAMLVGAIRTESEHTSDPVQLLGALNSRLYGREHAQATCLAMSIQMDGKAILANAGHIAPYLNGEPLAMEGALPLGMIESAEPSLMHFQLKDGDKLVLMSDGIAEATDAAGNLFGFERVHELLSTAISAAEVAKAAQSFGQEDDITVLSITRSHTPLPQPARS